MNKIFIALLILTSLSAFAEINSRKVYIQDGKMLVATKDINDCGAYQSVGCKIDKAVSSKGVLFGISLKVDEALEKLDAKKIYECNLKYKVSTIFKEGQIIIHDVNVVKVYSIDESSCREINKYDMKIE
jgi:hypothetical protein